MKVESDLCFSVMFSFVILACVCLLALSLFVTEKHKWKHAVCDHVEKRQKRSEAESFRHMKIKISYTHEDGHVGRNM
jgi:hypothetical protein